jgi:N-acetylglucosamine transport system substrate-binding protein
MTGLSRRRLLAGAGAALIATSCSGGDHPAPSRPVSADDPFGVADDRSLDVVGYDGGYGHAYVEYGLGLFRERHPNVTAKLTPVRQVRHLVQPRLQAGRPPDLIGNSGADKLSNQRMVDDHQLADLTPLLEAPSWDDPNRKVRDTLDNGVVESGSYDGVPRVLNYVNTVYAFWFSGALFDRHGWEPPKTWDELLSLGTAMKARKLPLIVYDGVHPQSVYEPILTLAAKDGGPDVLKHLDNLEDGAWQQDSVGKAAAAFGELAGRGLVFPGSKGLDDRQSQDRFVRARAGLIPSGNWLERETRSAMPKGFGLTALAPPPLDGSARLPNAVHVAPGEAYVVPQQAPAKAAGLELLRAMLSKQAAIRFTELADALTVVDGAADGMSLSPALKSANGLVSTAGDQVVNWFFASWYPGLGTATADATGALMAGAIEVGEWAERIQRAADDLKKNPAVTKYRRD